MKKSLTLLAALCFSQATLAGFETPIEGSTNSGLGLVRGWICEANQITISIDGGASEAIAYGNVREDTRQICGDADNGFETLLNWNNVGEGEHTITAYADGTAIGTHSFSVVTLGLKDGIGNAIKFVTGLSKTHTVPNFPETGRSSVLYWSQADQNFIIESVSNSTPNADLNVSGDWAILETLDSETCPGIGTEFYPSDVYLATIVQSGSSLSMTDDDDAGEPPITGSLSGNAAVLTSSYEGEEDITEMTFSSPTIFSGTVRYGAADGCYGSSTIVGVKQ